MYQCPHLTSLRAKRLAQNKSSSQLLLFWSISNSESVCWDLICCSGMLLLHDQKRRDRMGEKREKSYGLVGNAAFIRGAEAVDPTWAHGTACEFNFNQFDRKKVLAKRGTFPLPLFCGTNKGQVPLTVEDGDGSIQILWGISLYGPVT